MLSRRKLLSGASSAALLASQPTNALLRGITSPLVFPINTWSQGQLGTGGLITAIDVHPDGTMACRTDSFGGYVWNPAKDKWVQVLNINIMPARTFPTLAGDGLEDIRIARDDSSVIYMMWQGNVYKSVDKGSTFQTTGFPTHPLPTQTVTFGPIIGIDPINSDVVYAGTPSDGLFFTNDGGANWARQDAFGGGLPMHTGGGLTAASIGTDSTSITVGLGSKTFNNHGAPFSITQTDKVMVEIYQTGGAASLTGVITASNATSFTINVLAFWGNAGQSFNAWTVYPAMRSYGAPRQAGPSQQGSDSTTQTINMGLKQFRHPSEDLRSAHGFNRNNIVNGSQSKVWSKANPVNQMIGTVSNATAAGFDLIVTSTFGSGTFSDWQVGGGQQGGTGTDPGGSHRIVFDTSGGTTTVGGQLRTKNIYLHTYGIDTWRSTDGGVTWTPLPNAGKPNIIRNMDCDPFGVLWVVDTVTPYFCSNASKYDPDTGTWTPWFYLFGGVAVYFSVAVDRVNSASKATTHVLFGTNTFSADGGATWTHTDTGTRTWSAAENDVTWIANWARTYNLPQGGTGAAFDATGKAFFAGEGVWYTTPAAGVTSINYTVQSRGIEEFIGNFIVCPKTDTYFMGCWDIPFFSNKTSSSLYPSQILGPTGFGYGLPAHYAARSLDYQWDNPDNMVVLIGDLNDNAAGYAGMSYSTDGGVTWTLFPTQPTVGLEFSLGEVVVSDINGAGANTSHIVYVSLGERPPKMTTDLGQTWQYIQIPGVSFNITNVTFDLTNRRATFTISGDPRSFYRAGGLIGIFDVVNTKGYSTSALNNRHASIYSISSNSVTVNANPAFNNVTAASWASTSGGQATFTMQNNPSGAISPGESVLVSGINPSGYNGMLTVVSVSSTQVVATLVSDPGNFVSGGGIYSGYGYGSGGSVHMVPCWGPTSSYSNFTKSCDSDKGNGDIYLWNWNINNAGPKGFYKWSKATGLWSLMGLLNPDADSYHTETLKSAPGKPGHLFFNPQNNPSPSYGPGSFYYTTDGWATNKKVVGLSNLSAFGFGAPFPGESYPSIYASGFYGGTYGMWMCKDFNPARGVGTWTLCGDPNSPPGGVMSFPISIDGDKVIPGKVYAFANAGPWWGQFN